MDATEATSHVDRLENHLLKLFEECQNMKREKAMKELEIGENKGFFSRLFGR